MDSVWFRIVGFALAAVGTYVIDRSDKWASEESGKPTDVSRDEKHVDRMAAKYRALGQGLLIGGIIGFLV